WLLLKSISVCPWCSRPSGRTCTRFHAGLRRPGVRQTLGDIRETIIGTERGTPRLGKRHSHLRPAIHQPLELATDTFVIGGWVHAVACLSDCRGMDPSPDDKSIGGKF